MNRNTRQELTALRTEAARCAAVAITSLSDLFDECGAGLIAFPQLELTDSSVVFRVPAVRRPVLAGASR